jgi:predicted DNA-binding transcriptional regulator AlpA
MEGCSMTPASTPAVRLGVSALEARLNLDRSTIFRKYKDAAAANRFPEPHYISGERCWWLADVEAWEASEMARGSTRKSNLKARAKATAAVEVAR